MKKLLTIYLIGVVLSWFVGFSWISYVNKKFNRKTTYGDIALISVMSTFSWFTVTAISINEISELNIWDTPLNS